MIRASLTAVVALCAATAYVGAQELVLSSPIDCSLGDDCYIQQYVDHTDGEGVSDFRCSSLSYDGHKGTDFALRTLEQMRAGVDVIASAKGTVMGTRNSVDDVLYTAANAANVKGKECGNGLVLRHGDGWETQYCHMKKGSVQVKTGEVVEAGTVLGQIGLSGRTQFPHVHLSVRKDGKVVDPLDPDGSVTCGEPDEDTLWSEPLPYRAGAVLYAAFADHVPAFEDVKSGRAAAQSLPVDAPAIVVFGFGFGAKKGDQMRLILEGPTGILLDKTVLIKKNKAQLFRAIGRKLPKDGWPVGTYFGSVSLLRDGKAISTEKTKISVE